MSKLSNFQVGSPTVAAGGRRIQQIHATYANRNAIFTSTSIGLREKRQDSRIFAIETGDVRLEGQVAGDQACKVARQRPLSFVGGAIVGILALDISQGIKLHVLNLMKASTIANVAYL